MLGKKASLAPLIALLRSPEIAALALASLPPHHAFLAEYLQASEAERVALAAQWRRQRGGTAARGSASDLASVNACEVEDTAEYAAYLVDVITSSTFAYPLVLQHSYTQGRQTRWALAWSFDVEVCIAVAKYKLNKFRQLMGT